VAGVTVVRSLYNRFEHLVHELGKFGIVGGIALFINAGVFNAFMYAVPGKQIYGKVVATIVATCFTYVGNRYWVYKDRDKIDRGREMFFFFLINGIAAVIEVGAVFVTKYGLHMNSALAANIASYVFALPLGMLFRLYCYRTFVFPESLAEEPEAQAAPAMAYHPAHAHQRPLPETASR